MPGKQLTTIKIISFIRVIRVIRVIKIYMPASKQQTIIRIICQTSSTELLG